MGTIKLALIPPINLLPWALKTNYQLLLPQLLKEETYRTFYSYLCDDPSQYVIMDNGAAEGEQQSNERLLELVDIYQPHELVLPDVLEDGQATITAVRDFFRVANISSVTKLGAVAAGKNLEEAYTTVATLLTEWKDLIDVIYIPRSLVKPEHVGDRLRLATDIKQITNKEIHLLGTNSLWMEEIRVAAETGMIRGVDTSAAFSFAIQHVSIDKGPYPFLKRPDNYFFADCGLLAGDPMLDHNIDKLMEWTHGTIDHF